MKRYPILYILLMTSLVLPTVVGAQQQFIPNTTQTQNTGQRTFGGGVNFSGVGGAIAGCLGVGGKISTGLSALTKNLSGSGTQNSDSSGISSISGANGSVPTSDSKALEKLQAAEKKENCLDGVAYALGQKSLQQVTNKTINWVNTGFGGNPLYVRDAQSFLSSIENDQVRSFLQTSNILNQGSTNQLQQSVSGSILSMLTGRKLPQNTSGSTDPFISDFSQGGWTSFFKLIDPVNNPISQVLTQSQSLQNQINQNQTMVQQELLQGKGFLSQKKCVEYASGATAGIGASINPDGSPVCLKYETVTPGSVIAEQLSSITNSPVRQLEQADEINEVLGAYFDQMISSLFSYGIQSLSTSRRTSGDYSLSGGMGSNTIIGSNGQALSGSSGPLSFNQLQASLSTKDFNISNPRHIAAVLKTQKDFLNQMKDSQAALQKIPLAIGKLDYCMPGPNPNWKTAVEQSSPGFQGGILQGNPKLKGIIELAKYSLFDPVKNNYREFPGFTVDVGNVWLYTLINGKPATIGLLSSIAGGILGGPPTIDMSSVPPRLLFILDYWYDEYEKEMDARYSFEAVQTAFINTKTGIVEKTFAKNYIKDIYKQLSSLYGYSQSAEELSAEYNDMSDETQVNIIKLEAIRAEALDIVKVARARHIAEKKAQGITVNTACLDLNYDIKNTPILVQPRVEPDADTEIGLLRKYNSEFYAKVNP